MIRTSRLDLITARPDTVRAAIDGSSMLGALLGATISAGWPPELLDRDALEWTARWLALPSNDPQWGMRWIVLREEGARTLIGVAGFKGMPAEGAVEIGYSIVPAHQRRGYATEAVHAMVDRAFTHADVRRVLAETLPHLAPSIAVLERTGFHLIGAGSEPAVIRYERRRPMQGGGRAAQPPIGQKADS